MSVNNLSFSSINCNSLNLSNSDKKCQKNKIYGITKLKADIIFISDLRLSNRNLSSNIEDLKKSFLINPYCSYKFLYNSTQNKRGVGILIKNDINFLEVRRIADEEENFLLVMADIKGNRFTLCSIYGPNVHNKIFFTNLANGIRQLLTDNLIIGGDWNCTYSCDTVLNNIDCLNMRDLPNSRHSNYLKTLCNEFKLMDPYRGFYPNRRDFTFVPRNALRDNRSRIDFFLVTEQLFLQMVDCDISYGLQSKLFDHKAISLTFYPKIDKSCQGPVISNAILKNPDLDLVVQTAILECYILNLSIENTPLNVNGRQTILDDIGTIWMNIRRAGPVPSRYGLDERSEEDLRQRERCIQEITATLSRYPIETIQTYPLMVDNCLFLETLLNCVRNEVSSFQHFVQKNKKETKNKLISSLKALKSMQILDTELLLSTEKKLNLILEAEMQDALEKSPIFDHIHKEKMSPLFLKLAKGCHSEHRISDIRNSDGSVFNTDAERNEFIVTYFENIYKKSPTDRENYEGLIEQFLGPEILNNPIVRNSRLTVEEAARLESRLSINELDLSIEKANIRSAGGPDGIPNSFLKKYWRYLRTPLHNYTNQCFDANSLSQSFKTGAIRLIPKKGNVHEIKNWRPISLLNCVYKIVSRAINNRLKTVIDKINSRAQKGFTSSRYIQEVLINVIENIAFCKKNNISGSVVAIDMAKAFDSLNHGFMQEAYRFFGFGENFVKMLTLIGTGRSSCIMLDNGKHSRSFKIESGTMQGDAPSPSLFNINEQILLFKLEFDPDFKSIFINHTVPRPIFPPSNPRTEVNFINEANRETNKLDVFADDSTACTLTEFGSLSKVKQILSEFGILSGLCCNFEKTCVMTVGDRVNLSPEILELGFTFVEKIKILGIEIDFNLSNLTSVHEKTLSQIRAIYNFWHRFRLSLPGRLNVAKTLMFSQISYLGCFIMPTDAQVSEIQNIIDKFVTGTLRVARDRIYMPVEGGGLGSFNVREFIISLQVGWVKKAQFSTRDNWSYDFKKLGDGNCLSVTTNMVDPIRHPILHSLAASMDVFKKKFFYKNDNFKKAHLVNNPIFQRGHDDNRLLDYAFFQQVPLIEVGKISRLRFENVHTGTGMRPLDEINVTLDIRMNLLTYMRINTALFCFISGLDPHRTTDGTAISLPACLSGFKKGSKKIRKFFDAERQLNYGLGKLTQVNTYARVTGLNRLEDSLLKVFLSSWGLSCLSNRLREFIFKSINNILGLNTRLAHFVEENERGCTFCNLKNVVPLPDETFFHLFYECQTTENWLRFFEGRLFQDWDFVVEETRKKFWFYGILPIDNCNFNIFISIIIWILKYTLWEFKLQQKTPSNRTFLVAFFGVADDILKVSYFLRNEKLNCPFYVCRNWDAIRP